MVNLKFLEKPHVFLAEGPLGMVLWLIVDVADDCRDLRVTVGKGAKTLLPGESSHNPVAVDQVRGGVFDVPYEVRKRHTGLEPDEQVRVVWHAMHGQELLLALADDARNVFVNFLFEFGTNEVLTGFDGKNHLNVNLAGGIGHERTVENIGRLAIQKTRRNPKTPSGVWEDEAQMR